MSTKTIKCPVDGRLFATKRALKQHTATSHGNGNPAPKVAGNPAGASRRNKSSVKRVNLQGQSTTFSGSDLIGTITVQDTNKVGTPLLLWEINPTTLVNTRMAKLAQVFTRWRPVSLGVTVIPGAGVLTPGSYVIGWTADQHFEMGNAESRVQRLTTLKPNLLSVFGAPKMMRIPCDTTQKWYMVDPELGADSDHGLLIAVLAARVGGTNISINFRLDWVIEFNSPDLPAPSEDLESYPDPDYIPIFTDSVSDWADGKKLTFKHKEGGSVVPWIGVKDNVIYEPTQGVKVPYYDSAGASKEVKFFAKIKDSASYSSALACFAAEKDAKDYIKDGAVSHVLDYVKAGEFVTPALPTLKGRSVQEEPLLCLTHRNRRLTQTAPAAFRLNLVTSNQTCPSFNAGLGKRGGPAIDFNNRAPVPGTSCIIAGKAARGAPVTSFKPKDDSLDLSDLELSEN